MATCEVDSCVEWCLIKIQNLAIYGPGIVMPYSEILRFKNYDESPKLTQSEGMHRQNRLTNTFIENSCSSSAERRMVETKKNVANSRGEHVHRFLWEKPF